MFKKIKKFPKNPFVFTTVLFVGIVTIPIASWEMSKGRDPWIALLIIAVILFFRFIGDLETPEK